MTTGWDNGLCQDYNAELGRWFADRLGARHQLREMFKERRMKIKVSEATGPALDWMVESIVIAQMRAAGEHVKEWWVEHKQTDPSPYSTDWLWAGPIIERECIGTSHTTMMGQGGAYAWNAIIALDNGYIEQLGPTPLIAAMRCYVASKLGDEVEVPEE